MWGATAGRAVVHRCGHMKAGRPAGGRYTGHSELGMPAAGGGPAWASRA